MAKADLKKLFKNKETKSEELKEARAIKSGKISPEQYAAGEKMEEKMKKGGAVKKAMGGTVKSGSKAPVYGRALMRTTADAKGRALMKGK
jgi:hypothetical protein